MMEIEVTVSVKDLEKLTAEVQKMAEDVRAKIASGEIKAEPEPEVEPCDCPGCRHLDPRTRRAAGSCPGPTGPAGDPSNGP